MTREFQMSMFIRNEPFESIKEAIIISRDHSFIAFPKFSEKLTFLTP